MTEHIDGKEPLGLDAHPAFTVEWSDAEQQYVATASTRPTLSWLDEDPVEALRGLVLIVDRPRRRASLDALIDELDAIHGPVDERAVKAITDLLSRGDSAAGD